jgi:aprataxin
VTPVCSLSNFDIFDFSFFFENLSLIDAKYILFGIVAHLKSRATASRPKPKRSPHNLNFRNNLGSYIQNPSTFAPSTVIYHDNDFVYVRDLYPKSFVHTLLLPRDATKSAQHPFDALQDPEFLSAVCRESGNLVRLVSADLRRRFGGQNGRDWEAEVKVGVHMKPSMNHLHIHILSREHYSGCLKHAKHYSKFCDFLCREFFP